jgi:Ead/Ea22-like protein
MTVDLARLRALARDACPGPWDAEEVPSVDGREAEWSVMAGEIHVARCHDATHTDEGDAARNARFMAAACPEVMLALLDRLERAEAAANSRKA